MTVEDQVAAMAVSDAPSDNPKASAQPNSKPSTRVKRSATENQHPKFEPQYLAQGAPSPLSVAEGWVVPLVAPAYFSLEVFHFVLQQQALHPEQNSSLILRADKLPLMPSAGDAADDALAAQLQMDSTPIERLRVRFVARQVNRDGRLAQRNAAYSSDDGRLGLVLKTPEVSSAAEMPFYHPPVRQIAFIWEADESGDRAEGEDGVEKEGDRIYGRIYVAYLPFEDSPIRAGAVLGPPPKPPRKRSPLAGPPVGAPPTPVAPPATVLEDDSPEGREAARVMAERRLQRVCFHLLEKLHKHGHGSAHGYVKRVNHDVSDTGSQLRAYTRLSCHASPSKTSTRLSRSATSSSTHGFLSHGAPRWKTSSGMCGR